MILIEDILYYVTDCVYSILLQVQITRRVTFRRTTCTQATINTATLNVGALVCQSGCSGNIIGSSTLNCTDFGVFDGWSTGERTYTYNFGTTQPYFEAS